MTSGLGFFIGLLAGFLLGQFIIDVFLRPFYWRAFWRFAGWLESKVSESCDL